MGRKKSNRPVRTRPLPSIPRIFDCPRCEATAIRISMQADVALVECGNCLLKQTITNIKQIEEPVDIFGHFVDDYYNNIELHEMPEMETEQEVDAILETSGETTNDVAEVEKEVESPLASEEVIEEEEVHEEPAPMGFVPRTKGDVLKKKIKEKDSKKNKKLSFSSLSKD